MTKMEMLLNAHVPDWENANIFRDKPMMTIEEANAIFGSDESALVSVITKTDDGVYFEWQCSRCGAVLPSTEHHCPCEVEDGQ